LATQKRKHNRKHNRMCHNSGETGLPGADDTTRPWGESEQQTGAESQEESGGHEKVGLGQHDTHSLGDETVHEKEHERVEEHGGWSSFAVHELDVLARGGHENTGAERKKKSGGYGNFLGSDIGEHLIYVYIFFHELGKMIKCGTPHNLLV